MALWAQGQASEESAAAFIVRMANAYPGQVGASPCFHSILSVASLLQTRGPSTEHKPWPAAKPYNAHQGPWQLSFFVKRGFWCHAAGVAA